MTIIVMMQEELSKLHQNGSTTQIRLYWRFYLVLVYKNGEFDHEDAIGVQIKITLFGSKGVREFKNLKQSIKQAFCLLSLNSYTINQGHVYLNTFEKKWTVYVSLNCAEHFQGVLRYVKLDAHISMLFTRLGLAIFIVNGFNCEKHVIYSQSKFWGSVPQSTT